MICEYCLAARESHGEKLAAYPVYVDETDPDASRCHWCGDDGNDILYETERY